MRIEPHHIRMLASNGDHRLGGKDWDDVIVSWVAANSTKCMERIRCSICRVIRISTAVRSPRRFSSRAASTTIEHSYNGKSVELELTRDEFEHRCRHLLEKCRTICEIVMREADFSGSRSTASAHGRHDPHAFGARQ